MAATWKSPLFQVTALGKTWSGTRSGRRLDRVGPLKERTQPESVTSRNINQSAAVEKEAKASRAAMSEPQPNAGPVPRHHQ